MEVAEGLVPELRLGGLDVEFKENCRIEGAGIAKGSKEILLGQRVTAVGKTLFAEIKVDWVTVLYREADTDRVNPLTFKCCESSRPAKNSVPQCPQWTGNPEHPRSDMCWLKFPYECS